MRSIHPTADNKERISIKIIATKDQKNIMDVKRHKNIHDGKTIRGEATEDSLNGMYIVYLYRDLYTYMYIYTNIITYVYIYIYIYICRYIYNSCVYMYVHINPIFK
jgi:hypothetical protein